MYMYAWEYDVDPRYVAEFLAAYGPNGAWVALFQGQVGYVRTELHRDKTNPNRYLTLDYWTSAAAWEDFRVERAEDFERLDEECEKYTLDEREIGRFTPLDGAS